MKIENLLLVLIALNIAALPVSASFLSSFSGFLPMNITLPAPPNITINFTAPPSILVSSYSVPGHLPSFPAIQSFSFDIFSQKEAQLKSDLSNKESQTTVAKIQLFNLPPFMQSFKTVQNVGNGPSNATDFNILQNDKMNTSAPNGKWQQAWSGWK